MNITRDNLYRFPWSQTDNPGGWVEVTDNCNLSCPGCYRHTLEGHRSLNDIKEDILKCRRAINCDRMIVAGGEPLIYPHIVEVVDFITKNNLRPVILTNGENLTLKLGHELKKAGLAKFHFHVDSGQNRPGWEDKNEIDLNELRQHFADLLWEIKGIQCGYNVTVFPETVKYLPGIVDWCRENIHKVQHISLVAYRGFPVTENIRYFANGKIIDPAQFQHSSRAKEEISLSTDDMFDILLKHYSEYRPCAYLNGTSAPDTYKFLITVHLGSKKRIYGFVGSKTLEAVQVFYHLFKGRYNEFLQNTSVGRKIFLMSLIDKELRKTLKNFLKSGLLNPLRLFDRLYVQSISLQQPNELVEGHANLCDGCMNLMIHKDKIINSCRLDEYRMFGGLVIPITEKIREEEHV